MMSGHGTIDTAVEATKFGAMAFLEKPITPSAGAVEQGLQAAVAGAGGAERCREVGLTVEAAMTGGMQASRCCSGRNPSRASTSTGRCAGARVRKELLRVPPGAENAA
jgi:hypothetical protein